MPYVGDIFATNYVVITFVAKKEKVRLNFHDLIDYSSVTFDPYFRYKSSI